MNKVLRYIDWGFCLVMIPLLTFVFPIGRWVHDRPSFTVLLVGFMYLTYFVVRRFTVPMFFGGRRSRIISFLLFACLLAGLFALTYYHEGWPFYRLAQIYPHVDLAKVQMSQQRIWLAFLTVYLFATAIGLHEEVTRQRLRQQAIQHERDHAALAMYRAQLNPHFLYNTLNSLYGLIVTHSDRAEQAFVQFTELTRFMTAYSGHDSMPVEQSQQFLRDYIELQRLRLKPEIVVSLAYESDDPSARIAPMILFTFVENALKHGTQGIASGQISFRLKVSQGVLTFVAENPMASGQRPAASGNTCGTGLANCRKRLSLLYPNRHKLDISHDGSRYLVDLTIQIAEPT
ncbi:MAG: histidine kinase [Prevotella sp.]|nr:histidine kinase [Prevotella sp.]